jgi:hypothetical protein
MKSAELWRAALRPDDEKYIFCSCAGTSSNQLTKIATSRRVDHCAPGFITTGREIRLIPRPGSRAVQLDSRLLLTMENPGESAFSAHAYKSPGQ